ncbi:MAG: prepilin-type N-terminal cleavage/methylation domain-containing protein [bacterium]
MNKKGFSIIEVIAAIALLSIGIFTIAKMFPFGLQISKSSEEITAAAMAANEKMESLVALGYEGIGTGEIEAKQKISAGSFGDIYGLSRETMVSYVDGNLSEPIPVSDTGMKKIKITVYWMPSAGGEKNIEFNRLISKR